MTPATPLHASIPAQDGGSTGGGTVVLADGGSVPYDWLVVSLGAETSTFGVPGVKENALPFATFQDAQRVGGRGWASVGGRGSRTCAVWCAKLQCSCAGLQC